MESRQSFSRLTRPAGVWGSRASHSRFTLTALRAFPKRPKTTVLQSRPPVTVSLFPAKLAKGFFALIHKICHEKYGSSWQAVPRCFAARFRGFAALCARVQFLKSPSYAGYSEYSIHPFVMILVHKIGFLVVATFALTSATHLVVY